MHRFYAPDLAAPGDLVALPPGEAAHLARVLRLRPGDAVQLFDGCGRACEAIVESVRPDVRVRPGGAVEPAREAAVRLTLAAALLKGDGYEAVVRDAGMLGAAAVQPVTSARTEVAREALRRWRPDRWTRIALASVKQCGRAVLPPVAPPLDLRDLIAAETGGLRLMLVEPLAGAADGCSLKDLSRQPIPPAATLLIGPEGGWTPDEIDAARRAGWMRLTLGGRTLRADAVPAIAIAALWAIWGEL